MDQATRVVSNRIVIDLGSGAHLRPLGVADVAPGYVDGLNDPLVNRFMGIGRMPPQTLSSVRAYVENQAQRSDAILFGVFVERRLRGTCRLHNISSERADLGIALFDRSIWGRGWASRVVSIVANHAVEALACRRVWAGVAAQNTASHRVFAKAGFRRAPAFDFTWMDDAALMWVYPDAP